MKLETTDSRGNHYTLDPITRRYVQENPPTWALPDSERLESNRKNKNGTTRKYGWEQVYRNDPHRRRVCKGPACTL